MAYSPKLPSISTTISNSAAPTGWDFLGAEPGETVPRTGQPTFSGMLYAVGIPSVQYALRYFTMDSIGTGEVLKELVDGTLDFTYCGDAMDNAFLIGGSFQFSQIGQEGVLACSYTQNILVLGQRVDYI